MTPALSAQTTLSTGQHRQAGTRPIARHCGSAVNHQRGPGGSRFCSQASASARVPWTDRGCSHQCQRTSLCQHRQQIMVGQANELAVTVTATLPLAPAVIKVNACSMHAQGAGRCCRQSRRHDRDAPHPHAARHIARCKQHVTLGDSDGLQDRRAWPRVRPAQLAVRRHWLRQCRAATIFMSGHRLCLAEKGKIA